MKVLLLILSLLLSLFSGRQQTPDAAVAYAQLFDFSSYAYEAATEIVELRDGRARTLIGKL